MTRERWLVPVIAVGIVVVLGIFAVGGYVIYDHVFPMAAPLVCPDEKDIVSVLLTQKSDPSNTIEISDVKTLLQSFRNTQPTRNWSVQDYPAAETYYTIEIRTSAGLKRYFVYTENSQVYLESPYEGVYRAEHKILNLLEGSFKN